MNERLLRDFPFDRVELHVLVAPSESTTSASSAPFVLRLRPEIAPPRPPPAPAVKFFLAHDFALAAARARCDRFNRVRFALEMTQVGVKRKVVRLIDWLNGWGTCAP